MKIRVLLKEGTWDDSFKTPEYQSITLDSEQLTRPKIQELIAKQFGMTVVGDISVGMTSYSNVYLVEPEDVSNYATKTLVMKLSKNDKEYEAYEKIKQIRQNMMNSSDKDDVKASKYLPIVYIAQSLQISKDNPEYKSIIVMEPLKSFTNTIRHMPKTISGRPISTPILLVSMLKDEEFMDRVLRSILSTEEHKKLIRQIENQIFTGKIPNTSQEDQSYIDSLIQKNVVQKSKERFKLPEAPIEKILKDLNKPLTKAQIKKYEDWKREYDEDSSSFLNNIKFIKKELRRIGFILIDNLGQTDGREMFDNMLDTLDKSTPVAPVSEPNPHPQNPITRPEEVTPGAPAFNDALQRLEQYGLSRRDIHGKNYMMREDGQIVISDPGLFKPVTPIEESKNANRKIKIKTNY
jgi:hypothetical protein